jgi:hypothetical protein
MQKRMVASKSKMIRPAAQKKMSMSMARDFGRKYANQKQAFYQPIAPEILELEEDQDQSDEE